MTKNHGSSQRKRKSIGEKAQIEALTVHLLKTNADEELASLKWGLRGKEKWMWVTKRGQGMFRE